jgi:hypothetical protein
MAKKSGKEIPQKMNLFGSKVFFFHLMVVNVYAYNIFLRTSSSMIIRHRRGSLPSPFGLRSKQGQIPTTKLHAVIPAYTDDDLIGIDEGLGGVRLAMDSAIKVVGELQPPSPNMKLCDLVRYTKVTEIPKSQNLKGVQLLCTGYGKECYHDPGKTTLFRVELAPMEAARNAIESYQSQQQSTTIDDTSTVVVNILGGGDLMIHECIDAVKEITRSISIPASCMVKMHALCHSSFPDECASVTVLALPKKKRKKQSVANDKPEEEEVKEEEEGLSKIFTEGDVYVYQDKWWTVVDRDITTATEINSDGTNVY